jgi:hypothetical protein
MTEVFPEASPTEHCTQPLVLSGCGGDTGRGAGSTAFSCAHARKDNASRGVPCSDQGGRRRRGSGIALAMHSGEWLCSSSAFSRGRCTYLLHPRRKKLPTM